MHAPSHFRPQHPFLCALALFLLGACNPTSPPGPSNSAAPQAGPTATEGAPMSSSQAPQDTLVALPPNAIVGTATRNQPKGLANPSEYCVDGRLYQGATYRLGALNLFGPLPPGDLDGQAIVVHGHIKTGLWSKLAPGEPCAEDYGAAESMMQLRSDWMAPETGFQVGRSTQEILERTAYIAFETLYPLDCGSISADATEAKVTVRNPFTVPLTSLQLVAHYERMGHGGKPMPEHRALALSLAPGATQDVVFPLEIPEEHLILHDFLLHGDHESVTIAVTLHLPR